MNPIDKAIVSNVKQHFQMYAERSVEGTCGKCCPFVYACDRIDRKTYDDSRLCENYSRRQPISKASSTGGSKAIEAILI